MSDDLSSVEGHEQALAGALGVPDDADAAVALGARGGDRALDRMAYGVELVIPGHDLDEAGAGVFEHGEIPHQGQEPGLLEYTLDDRSELRRALRRDSGAVHGAPGHEAFEAGRQRAEARMEAVRGHERGVRAEQGRYLVLVGLELVERPVEGGVLVAGVLQFNDSQGQAVDEQDHVGAAIVPVLDNRVLVHRPPVVGVHVVEVDQPGNISADAAVLAGDFDRHALDQVAVQTPVLLDERGGLSLLHLAQHLLQCLGGQVRVEAFERLPEPFGQ